MIANEINKKIKKHFPNRKIDRVLLINPPDVHADAFAFNVAKRKRSTNYPPYGLAVMVKFLSFVNVKCNILNLNHLLLKEVQNHKSKETFDFDLFWKEKLQKSVETFQPDMIGVSCMFTLGHRSLKNVCEFASSLGVPVAIGGVHVTNDIKRVLEDIPSVAFAFIGEAGLSLQDFVRSVRGIKPIEAISQIAVNTSKGVLSLPSLNLRPEEGEILDLMPAHGLVEELGEYSHYGKIGSFYWLLPENSPVATVISNYGCRAACTFCSVRNFNGSGVRQRSVSAVVDEMQYLHETYGIIHFVWLDDDLLKNEKRAISLFNEIVKRNLGITWDASNGVIAFSCKEEVISAAEDSGCIGLNIGMESGNPKILHKIKKPGKVETFLRAAEVLRKHPKIHSSVLLMIGFPNETLNMIFDTINVSKQMDLDWYRVTPLIPLPNTPIYDSMIEEGLVDSNIKDPSLSVVPRAGGPNAQQVLEEQSQKSLEIEFNELFKSVGYNSVPTPNQLTDIWFYMNYYLNFERLFREENHLKIQQQISNLKNINDVISPENGFALYFWTFLEHRLTQKINKNAISRLRQRLDSSVYWKDRLSTFGLTIDKLENLSTIN